MLEDHPFIKRKLEKADEKAYQVFKLDFDFLSEQIVTANNALRDKHNLQYISYKPNSGESVDLCETSSLLDYFQTQVDEQKERWLQTLKNYYEVDYTAETFNQYVSQKDPGFQERIKKKIELETWSGFKGLLYEWAVLSALLRGFRRQIQNVSREIIFGANQDPVVIVQDNRECYMWYQKTLEAQVTGLNARPDILITSDPSPPKRDNIVGIIECKNISSLGAKVIREEYGKSHDVGADYTIIHSYGKVRRSVIDGAAELGLSIFINALSTNRRGDMLSYEVMFLEDIRNAIEDVAKVKPFKIQEEIRKGQLDKQ